MCTRPARDGAASAARVREVEGDLFLKRTSNYNWNDQRSSKRDRGLSALPLLSIA
jgi:hypothetical protein